MYTPERHLPTPGQRGHSPQRHTAAGTAAPTTTDTGNTVQQRANPHSNGLCSPPKEGPGPGSSTIGSERKIPVGVLCYSNLSIRFCAGGGLTRASLLCIMIGSVLYPWVNGDPLNPGFRVRIPVQLSQGYKTDPIMICKNSKWRSL